MASRTYNKQFTLTNASAQLSLGLSANETLQIANASIVNSSGVSVLAYLNLAGDGAAAGTGNTLEVQKPIGAYETVGSALTGAVVNPGGKIYGYAGTTGVIVVHISGIASTQAPVAW